MKKTKRLLALLLSVTMACSVFTTTNVFAVGSTTATTIATLKVNDVVSPVGIDNTNPVFSWQMKSDEIGQCQTAYQLLVAKDDQFKNMIWDSGKQTDDRSVGIAYGGNPLESSTTYYWKVTTWDKDGTPVASDASTFEMGLLGANAWDGSEWIQVSNDMPPINPNLHYTVTADVTCQNIATGIVFNAKDTSNFYMWQFNTADQPGKVLLRPHTWTNGTAASYDASHMRDITSLVGGVENFKTEEAHIKIDVTATEIKTYINKTLVDTFPFTDSKSVGPYFGSIGVRSSATERGTVDNLKGTDYTDNADGEVVYDYNFDTENPFGKGTIENGKFIVSGVEVALPTTVSDVGSSTFRTEFTPDREVESAKLYTTALGVYDVYLNDQRVGRYLGQDENGQDQYFYDELKPGFTQIDKRMLYHSYDVTHQLKDGANALSAIVTPGWWSGAIVSNYGKNNAFRAKMIIHYTDGTQEVINTNTDWKTSIGSPVRLGDIYKGETYDANVDTSWKNSGYDDSSWQNAKVNTEFKGVISAHVGAPIQVRGDLELSPKSITVYEGAINASATQHGNINTQATYTDGQSFDLEPGQTAVFDLGQNFAGWPEIKVEGTQGTKITMLHGEMLNDNDGLKSRGNDGPEGSIYRANLRSAPATGTYIMNGQGVETYHTTFSFYGFRYVSITATEPVKIHGLKGQVVTSVAEETGKLTTSNKDVNQLISNVLWGQYSNYLSVPTDCPQRDERLGWTADTQVFATAAAYNAESKGFLTKWMQDMRDSQRNDGAYPDTAPRGIYGGHGQLGWADAGVIVPYNMYKMYGDASILKENYTSMQKFMDVFMANTNKNGGGHAYGDWLAYESNDDEIKNIIGVAYYAWDAQMMAEIAQVLGKTDDVAKYQQVYEVEKQYFQDQYVLADGTLKRGEQTACLMALKMDLLPNEASKQAVIDQLLSNVKRNGNKLQTGFLGTATIMETLTEVGATEVAYQLLLQRDNPSWLYSVDQGATTIWERWNSYTKESGFGDVGMNSFNHYSYGAVAEWMYRYMAGIEYDFDNPGFKHIILQPTPDQVIKSVDSSYVSAYGTITSSWKYEGKNFVYDASIPANTTATIYLPIEENAQITVNGKTIDQLTQATDGLKYVETVDGKAVFEAVSGSFHFTTDITVTCVLTLKNADASITSLVSINGGEPQKMPPLLKVNAGEEITLEAIPHNDVDYKFASWSGDFASTNSKITITPMGDMTLTTNYVSTGLDNLALGAKADSNSIHNAPPAWAVANITDGILNHFGGNNGYTSGGFASPDVSKTPVTVTLDLGEATDFNRIQLYPRTDTLTSKGTTLNFPVHYQILTSTDGKIFDPIYEIKDQVAPYFKPVVIAFDALQNAQYVQIKAFVLGDRDIAGNDQHRLQFSEIGLYNNSVTPPVDRTKLDKAITDAEAIKDLSIYTDETATAFTNALNAAKAVSADADQATIDAATDTLNTARTNLKRKPPVEGDANKTILNFVINYADLKMSQVATLVPSAKVKFMAAYNNAVSVKNATDATQEQVDQAWVMLMDAIHMLSFQAGDKTQLIALITACQGLDLDRYKDTVAFEAALAAAIVVRDDADAFVADVQKAYDDLNKAMNELVLKDNNTYVLESAINYAQGLTQDLLVDNEAKSAIFGTDGLLAKAKAVLADSKATQEQIDAAADALFAKIAELRYKADKATLEEVLKSAATVDENDFTPASFSTFKQAVKAGQGVLADPNATEEQIEKAVADIQAAQKALIKAETSGERIDSKDITADGANDTTKSATTGDSNAVTMIAIMMLISSAVVVFGRKKSK